MIDIRLGLLIVLMKETGISGQNLRNVTFH